MCCHTQNGVIGGTSWNGTYALSNILDGADLGCQWQFGNEDLSGVQALLTCDTEYESLVTGHTVALDGPHWIFSVINNDTGEGFIAIAAVGRCPSSVGTGFTTIETTAGFVGTPTVSNTTADCNNCSTPGCQDGLAGSYDLNLAAGSATIGGTTYTWSGQSITINENSACNYSGTGTINTGSATFSSRKYPADGTEYWAIDLTVSGQPTVTIATACGPTLATTYDDGSSISA